MVSMRNGPRKESGRSTNNIACRGLLPSLLLLFLSVLIKLLEAMLMAVVASSVTPRTVFTSHPSSSPPAILSLSSDCCVRRQILFGSCVDGTDFDEEGGDDDDDGDDDVDKITSTS